MKKIGQGIMIGIANAIPGVSGATLAIMLGCYDNLLTITSKPYKIKTIWQEHLLLIGIIIGISLSVFALSYLYQYIPLLVTSYFVGLIIGGLPGFIPSNEVMEKQHYVLFCLGLAMIILVDWFATSNHSSSLAVSTLLIGGALASLAMILPGVSGSMMLLALGNYFLLLGEGKAFLEALFRIQMPAFTTLSILFVFGFTFVITLILGSLVIKKIRDKYSLSFLSFSLGLIIGSLIIIIFTLPFHKRIWFLPLELSVGMLLGIISMLLIKLTTGFQFKIK